MAAVLIPSSVHAAPEICEDAEAAEGEVSRLLQEAKRFLKRGDAQDAVPLLKDAFDCADGSVREYEVTELLIGAYIDAGQLGKAKIAVDKWVLRIGDDPELAEWQDKAKALQARIEALEEPDEPAVEASEPEEKPEPEEEPEPESEPEPEPTAQEEGGRTQIIAGAVLTGVSGVGFALTGVFWNAAAQQHENAELTDDDDLPVYDYGDAERRRKAGAYTGLAVGIVSVGALAAGITLIVLGKKKNARKNGLAIAPTFGQSSGVVLTGRF